MVSLIPLIVITGKSTIQKLGKLHSGFSNQAALSSVQHQNYQWAAMIGARPIAVCAMISILKQREEAQAAAELQAADTMLPATVQVQVNTSKANDAAANLPVGHVASGSITDTAQPQQPQQKLGGSGKRHNQELSSRQQTP